MKILVLLSKVLLMQKFLIDLFIYNRKFVNWPSSFSFILAIIAARVFSWLGFSTL